jgi:hypothetical protein
MQFRGKEKMILKACALEEAASLVGGGGCERESVEVFFPILATVF